MHGENLSEHMNRELPEDPITFLIWLGASGITYEDGQCLAALEKVLDGDYKVRKMLKWIYSCSQPWLHVKVQ